LPAKYQLAAATVVAFALIASAMPATAGGWHHHQSLEVRSGPGAEYRVVDRLHVGDAVDVRRCVGEWCYIWKWDCDGWVLADRLTISSRGSPGYFMAPWIEPFVD
jgi:uncharacterized protein YraI